MSITTAQLLAAYAQGYFPMADARDGQELRWYWPEQRGVLPLEGFHLPRSLAKFLKTAPFTYSTNQAFAEVIAACATREETWINTDIEALYTALHYQGFAHSVECWENGMLVGGLYGVALGGAFFGESMFSTRSNASKAALVHLVSLLRAGGYTLLDAQYVNAHLTQFGILEMPRAEYLVQLEAAIQVQPERVF